MVEVQIGEILQMRKPHPCGSYAWKVVRLGAEIGLECLTCQRRILLTRRELAKRIKRPNAVSNTNFSETNNVLMSKESTNPI